MTEADAVELLGGQAIGDGAPTIWADLGCGDGTFTRALARLLAPGSVIHAMDRDAAALRAIPAVHDEVSILTHVGDFTTTPWPFSALDGVLLANSLHYVKDQPGFIRACVPSLKSRRRFVIVEYDISRGNRWVPYPVNQMSLRNLFRDLGYSRFRLLGARPSVYQNAGMYAAAVEAP